MTGPDEIGPAMSRHFDALLALREALATGTVEQVADAWATELAAHLGVVAALAAEAVQHRDQ